MAKYLDSNGLRYFSQLIKNFFSWRGHYHTVSASTGSSATVTAGTAANLSTVQKTFVTDASKVTLGTAKSITPVTKKTVVTGVTKKTVVTGHTPMSAVCSQGLLTLTADSSTTGDSVTVTTGDSVTAGTAISVPQLTVAAASTDTVKGVDTFTANTPTAVTPKTVVTSVTAQTSADQHQNY